MYFGYFDRRYNGVHRREDNNLFSAKSHKFAFKIHTVSALEEE